MGVPYLPLEILRKIFGFVSLPVLRNVRLANHLFYELGSEFFLLEVHVIFTLESLERLKAIALHGTLSKHVRSLVYEGDRLALYGALRLPNTEDDIADRDDVEKGDTEEKVRLENYKRSYNAILREQKTIEEEELYCRAFAVAVARFPKLKYVRLNSHSDTGKKQPQQITKYYLDRLASKEGISPAPVRSFRQPAKHIDAIWKTIKTNSRIRLEKLLMEDVSMDSFDRSGPVEPLDWSCVAGNLQQISLIVEERRMGMELPLDEEAAYFQERFFADWIYEFLRAAPLLEDLYLRLKLRSDRRVGGLWRIFGEETWAHLKTLHLNMVYSQSSDLLEFLGRHQALECVTLTSPTFQAGDSLRIWGNFLLEARRMREWRAFELHGQLVCGRQHSFFIPFSSREGQDNTLEEWIRLWVKIPLFTTRKTRYNPLVTGSIPGFGDKPYRALTEYDDRDAPKDEEEMDEEGSGEGSNEGDSDEEDNNVGGSDGEDDEEEEEEEEEADEGEEESEEEQSE